MSTQLFVKPTENLLDNLGPGCFVRVNQGNGPFWVEIKDGDGYMFDGKVHPQFSGDDCPFHGEAIVVFNREEINAMGCDNYCFC